MNRIYKLCDNSYRLIKDLGVLFGRAETDRDGTRAGSRLGFPAKRMIPFISAGMSVQSRTGLRGVRFGGERLYYR